MNNHHQTDEDARLAWRRLQATVAQVRSRFEPQSIVEDAISIARRQGRTALIGAATSAKTRPWIAAGMIVAGVAFLLRVPLLTMITNRFPQETDNVEQLENKY